MSELTKYGPVGMIIKPNGDWSVMPKPESGDVYSLKEIQNAVGGYVHVVPMPKDMRTPFTRDRMFFCDEDGLLKKLPVNLYASLLLGQAVCGTIVGIPKDMVE